MAITEQCEQIWIFQAFGQQQRAAARIRVGMYRHRKAEAFQRWGHFLDQIAVQFRAQFGHLGGRTDANPAGEIVKKGTAVKMIRRPVNSRIASHGMPHSIPVVDSLLCQTNPS